MQFGENAGVLVEYAQFLYHRKRYSEALLLVEKALTLNKKSDKEESDKTCLTYTRILESITLPYLQQHLKEKSLIKIEAIFIAHHLKVLCYHALEVKERNQALLSFEQYVLEEAQAQGYECLAYTYEYLSQAERGKSYRRQSEALEALTEMYADQDRLRASGAFRITQSGILSELGDCYLDRQDYRSAALLYNGALSLLEPPRMKSILEEGTSTEEKTEVSVKGNPTEYHCILRLKNVDEIDLREVKHATLVFIKAREISQYEVYFVENDQFVKQEKNFCSIQIRFTEGRVFL